MEARSSDVSVERLIDELARVLHEPERARALVLRARFPPATLPPFDDPRAFWESVIHTTLHDGLGGVLQTIVIEASTLSPSSAVFDGYRDQATASRSQDSRPPAVYEARSRTLPATPVTSRGPADMGPAEAVARYDVFLSCSSSDESAVEAIAARLHHEARLRPFWPKWELVPGESWMPALERAIEDSTTVAVFFGSGGRDGWQQQEAQLALAIGAHRRGKRVIPVLLPGADEREAAGFLGLRTWVDLAGPDGFARLVAGVIGHAPRSYGGSPTSTAPRSASVAAAGRRNSKRRASVLATAMALVASAGLAAGWYAWSSQAARSSPATSTCPTKLQRIGEGCVSQRVFDFMSCTEERGINRDVLERSIKRIGAGDSGLTTIIDPSVAAGSMEEIVRQDRSTPSNSDCSIISTCAELAGASAIQCPRATAPSRLPELAYPATAGGLAQALRAADTRALDSFAGIDMPSSVIAVALQTREAQGKPSVAQQYFEATRSNDGASWLTHELSRELDRLDPNLRVPSSSNDEESLLNVAVRAGNVMAANALLDAGANPHGYQRLEGIPDMNPRFLAPLDAVLTQEQSSLANKEKLIEAFISRGAVVAPIPPVPTQGGAVYGPIAHGTLYFQEKMKFTLGHELAYTPNICEQFPQDSCERVTTLYHVDWCSTVREMPTVVGRVDPAALDDVIPAFVVRYFLGADAHNGYFLAEELSYESGYALLEVDPDLRQLRLFRYQPPHFWGDPSCSDGSQWCWRRFDLVRDVGGKHYDAPNIDPLPISHRCEFAEEQASVRARAIGPRTFEHEHPGVARCVNDILRTPDDDLFDEATKANVLSPPPIPTPRSCVLMQLNVRLILGDLTHMVTTKRHEEIVKYAQQCCEQKHLGKMSR